jgi:transposase
MEEEIEQLDRGIETIAAHDSACQRLSTVPGIGVLIATATVAAVGNGAAFSRGREFAKLGGKTKLLGISKNGNEYLRRLFIAFGNCIRDLPQFRCRFGKLK